MKDRCLSFRRYRRRLLQPLRSGSQRIHEREGLWVTLHGPSADGYGEAAPADWVGGESVDSIERNLTDLVQVLQRSCPPLLATLVRPERHAARPERHAARPERDAAFEKDSVDPLLKELHRKCPEDMGPSAYSALETAAIDLAGRSLHQPAFSLLLPQSSLPARTGPRALAAPLVHLVAAESPEAIGREAEKAISIGYRHFKLKVGGRDLERDIERVRRLVNHIGASSHLRLDANRSWSSRQADHFLDRIPLERISCLEEPLATPQARELCALRERHGVPIGLDESILGHKDIERAAETGACDLIVLKLARLGGPVRTIELANLARAAGLEIIVTDSLETEIGQAATLHTAMAIHGPQQAVGLAGAALFENQNQDEPACERTVRGPGLGISPPMDGIPS